jgi:phage gpG-like protein
MAAPGASLRLEFDLRDLDKLAELLERGFADFTEPLQQCGVITMRSVDLNFQEQGRPTRWQALKGITLFLRREGGGEGGAQILQDTGRLKQSVTWGLLGSGSAPPGAVYELGPTSLRIGSNLPYAAIHQFGGTVKAKKKALARQVPDVASPLGARRYKGKVYVLFGPSVTIPARPYLTLQPEDLDDFGQVFADWAQSKFDSLTGGT